MKKIIVIDGSAWMHRAFHSLDSIITLIRSINNAIELHKPDIAYVAHDHAAETWRTKLYPKYKANRPPSPEGYIALKPAFKRCFEESGIIPLSCPGFEADDVIASICASFGRDEIVILSQDKDLMQLIVTRNDAWGTGGVSMWHDRFIQEADVVAKFGVAPYLIPDLFGLMGDSTDGIPGVAGVGQKTASTIVSRWGNLDYVYENLDALPPTQRMLLKHGREAAFLSRELATLRTDCPLNL